MTIAVLIMQCYKIEVFFMNYSILASSFCMCRNINYVTILIGSCSSVLFLGSLKCTGRLCMVLCVTVCVSVGVCLCLVAAIWL